MCRRAETREVDLRGRQAGDLELIARALRSLEEPMLRTIAVVEPAADVLGRESVLLEAVDDVSVYLVSRGADRRTDCRDQILGTAAEFTAERVDDNGRHAGGKSPPAGVRRGDGAGPAIGDENGDAVGGLNRERDGRIVGHENVGIRKRRSGRSLGGAAPAHDDDRRTMHLMDANEISGIHADCRRDFTPALLVIRTNRAAERPGARREAMRRELRERVADQRRAKGGLRPAEGACSLW